MADLYSGGTTGNNDYNVEKLAQALADVYSLDLLHKAMPVMRYPEFAVRKTELMKTAGDTIKFTRYNDIGRGGKLKEEDKLSTRKMSASQFSVAIDEWGNAIGVSERLLQTSFDDVLSEAAFLLGRDYALVRDESVRDALVASGSTLFTTPGALAKADVDEADKFDVETLRQGLEILRTKNAPKFLGDFYVCFLHTHQAAYLRRDPDWVSANNYAQTRALFSGEVGRWEDCVFIETTLQGNGAAGVGNAGYEAGLVAAGKQSQHLYRATLLADQCIALAEALPVEMRDNGIEDFGRKHALAWYAMWGVGILDPDYLVHVISS